MNCQARVILNANREITPEDILALEQFLNNEVATQVWQNVRIGLRVHMSAPDIRSCAKRGIK